MLGCSMLDCLGCGFDALGETRPANSTAVAVKYSNSNQTNRHTPHPALSPLRGEGKPTTLVALRPCVAAFITPRPVNATACARRTSLEIEGALTAAPSPLNGERAG